MTSSVHSIGVSAGVPEKWTTIELFYLSNVNLGVTCSSEGGAVLEKEESCSLVHCEGLKGRTQ